MKIAVIGVARSKTEVLLESIKYTYPNLTCLYEHYTYGIKKNISLEDMQSNLKDKNNYIVKILSHNIFNNEEKISGFNFETFDKIYLIERPDFFNQCCSLQVASDSKIWHQRGKVPLYDDIKNKKFILHKDTILYQANGVTAYLKIKNYLISNKIEYTQHPYDSTFTNLPKACIEHTNLDYSNIIQNYDLKDDIQNLFELHFNYELLKHDFENFKYQLDLVWPVVKESNLRPLIS